MADPTRRTLDEAAFLEYLRRTNGNYDPAATHAGPQPAQPRPAFAVGADALARFASSPAGSAIMGGLDQLEQHSMRPLAYWSNRLRGNADVAEGIWQGGRYEPGMVTGNQWADMALGAVASPDNLIPGLGLAPSPFGVSARFDDALGLTDWSHVPGLDRARAYTAQTVPPPSRVGTLTPTGRVSQAALDAQQRITRRLAPRILRNPTRLAQLDQAVQAGMAAGGHTWYRTDQMRDLFRRALGNDQDANELFNVVALMTAATSPQTRVRDNIQRALTLVDQVYAGRGYNDIKQFLQANPGYRSQLFDRTLNAAMMNDDTVRQALEQGTLNGQKVSTFLTNYLDNLQGVTVDTHNLRALLYYGGMDFRTPKGRKQIAEFFSLPADRMAEYQAMSGPEFIDQVYGRISTTGPSGAAYSALEDLNRTLAARYNLSPRDFQSVLWVGAADITGVDDITNFDQLFMDVLQRRASAAGITPEEVIQRMVSGQINFADILGEDGMEILRRRLVGAAGDAAMGDSGTEEVAPAQLERMPIPTGISAERLAEMARALNAQGQ